jgi:hypothetical protein
MRRKMCIYGNYWWQKSDIWSQASYRYPISWEVFFDLSDSYFLFAEERGYHKWALAHSSSCFPRSGILDKYIYVIQMMRWLLSVALFIIWWKWSVLPKTLKSTHSLTWSRFPWLVISSTHFVDNHIYSMVLIVEEINYWGMYHWKNVSIMIVLVSTK